jgi:hypothetical protein
MPKDLFVVNSCSAVNDGAGFLSFDVCDIACISAVASEFGPG